MTQRVGAKGQVVIPKAIRDELDLQPGREVEFLVDGDAVRVRRAVTDLRHLGGKFAGSDMAAALLEDRARESR